MANDKPTQAQPATAPTQEPIVVERYSYAAMVLNPDFVEITQHLGHLCNVSNFSKTSGIPSLQYFNAMMNGKNETAKRFQSFVEDCIDSPDILTNFPKAQTTLGNGEMYDVPFNAIPTNIAHALNLHAALVYFRKQCGYVEEKVIQTDKNVSMSSLVKVKEDGVKSNR